MATEPDAPASDDRATDDSEYPPPPASTDASSARGDQGTIGTDADGLVGLTIRAVQYPNGPTRCTMYPDGRTGMARLETWLSADQSAFVDLEAWR